MTLQKDSALSYLSVGTTVGVALGMVIAPKSGSQSQNYLRTSANEGLGNAWHRVAQACRGTRRTLERGTEILDFGKHTMSGAVDAGKRAYEETVNRISGLASPSPLNVLVDEAILVGIYKITRGIEKRVLPRVEALLDTSHMAVGKGANHLTDVSVKVGHLVDA